MLLNFDWLNTVYENTDPPADPPADPPTPTPTPTPTPKARVYTQKELEEAIETERKQNNERTRNQISELEKLKKTISLTDVEKSSLQRQIDELSQTLLSKEELAKKDLERERREKEESVKNLTTERDSWKNRFETSLIEREITDAANHFGAYSAKDFIARFKSTASLEEIQTGDDKSVKFAVKVRVDGKDKDGKPNILSLSPEQAVQYMYDSPEQYGYLFKSKGTGGLGLDTKSSKLPNNADYASMSMEEYKKHRANILKGK